MEHESDSLVKIQGTFDPAESQEIHFQLADKPSIGCIEAFEGRQRAADF
jgi:hypothetical protein